MDAPDELTVEVKLRPHDIYSPFRWQRDNIIRWVAAGLLCLIFRDVYALARATLVGIPSAGSIRAIVVVLAVFVLLALLLFPYLRMRALFRSTPALSQPTRITFRPEHVLFENQDATADCKWEAFIRITETRHVFVFSQGGIGGTYIPKRCFAQQDDIQRLRRMICESFKGKWSLRRD
jgi:hypothetical protein